MGLSEEEVAELGSMLEEADDDGGGIWMLNVDTVLAFNVCGTQWRMALVPDGLGFRHVFVGLDYTAAKAGLELAGVDVDPELWRGVMVMEQAALGALNKRSG